MPDIQHTQNMSQSEDQAPFGSTLGQTCIVKEDFGCSLLVLMAPADEAVAGVGAWGRDGLSLF